MIANPLRFARIGLVSLALLAFAQPARAAEPNTLSPEEVADGWILLFDGETLFGWRPATQVDWQVVDGAITASEGENGLLYTTGQFGDYQLQVDFRCAWRQ